MMLFPCGHTFCTSCLSSHFTRSGKQTCPVRRSNVESQAPNVSLQQMIDGFVERQNSYHRGELLPEVMQDSARGAASEPLAAAGGGVWLPGRSQATRCVDISMNATSPPRARSDIRAGPRGAFLRSEGLLGVRC